MRAKLQNPDWEEVKVKTIPPCMTSWLQGGERGWWLIMYIQHSQGGGWGLDWYGACAYSIHRGLAAVLPKAPTSTTNSGTKAAVLPGMNRCGSSLLFSAPHSLFSIWTDLRWGEWIWLTGPSRLHWNSPQEFNISSIRVFDQIADLEIPITLCPHLFYMK